MQAAVACLLCRPGSPLQVAGGGELPGWVLATFLANCMADISGCSDAVRQSRHVRLLCACVTLVAARQPGALAESLPELLSFCIQVGAEKESVGYGV